VALNCYISWDYDPDLIDMMAYVSSSDYTAIQATREVLSNIKTSLFDRIDCTGDCRDYDSYSVKG